MISDEQKRRCEKEFADAQPINMSNARMAEHALEDATYRQGPYGYDPKKRDDALRSYAEADYMAESRAWILELIREALAREPKPMPDLMALHDRTIKALKEFVEDGNLVTEQENV